MNGAERGTAALVVAVWTFLFGRCDGLFTALLCLIALDYITGVIAAAVTKKLSSAVGAKGIAKKVFMLAIVAIANVIDVNVIGDGGTLKAMVIFFYLANEAISLIENAGRLGVPVPSKLLDILAQLRNNEEDRK